MNPILITIIAATIINTVILIVILVQSKNNKEQERLERILRDEIAGNRKESGENLRSFGDSLQSHIAELTKLNDQKLENVRESVEKQLRFLQQDNNDQLEKMRETVDEKLQSTLEKRLGESFKVVSERLEKVHQGLGEMQTLASGVGDLKKVLTNVKTRGTWGEIQLENLLEQILTPDQYDKNVVTKKGSRDPVEFAIKLPGKEGNVVYIPIDAKFPKEDYERLLAAQEEGNLAAIEDFSKAVENRIKGEAKKIKDKYIDPPNTTDFGILYLPIEGLYAEVLRRPGLYDFLQREYRVTLSCPTTITALLNSLQMGFRTLAVEKRASEVWTLLGAVKSEFGKFGVILEKTHTKLKQASDEIETAARKTRTIERKLKKVQELPASQQPDLLEDSLNEDESIDVTIE